MTKFYVLSTFLWVALVLTSCGGGNSTVTSSTPPPPPTPTFSLTTNPGQIGLSQTATQSLQVNVNPQNGFAGSVTITESGLPAGVTASPATLTVDAGSTGTLTLAASSSATPGTVQVSFSGTAGSQQASTTLSLEVIQMTPPISVPFTVTGGMILKGFYDEARQLLFVCNLGLNEVDVLSGIDLTVQARIPVAQPFGVDQMPDGNTLVVGTATQSFYTIDENTLAATHHLAPNFTQQSSITVATTPVAMANGKVLFLGTDIGAGGASIYIYGAQSIIEWDSISDQFSVPYYVPYPTVEIDDLRRSSDHKWAVFASDQLYIYSSATDTFVSSATPVRNLSVEDVAVSPNGSQFAVVSNSAVSFYDVAFNSLGTITFSEGGAGGPQRYVGSFSSDGSLFYLELGAGGYFLDVISTESYTELGHVTTDFGNQTHVEPVLLAVNSAQQAFIGAAQGIGRLECKSPHTDTFNFVGSVGTNPNAIPLNQSASIKLTSGGIPAGTSVTFGGQLAPVTSDQTANFLVQVPPSQVAGPVNLVFARPDGETFSNPQAFVYGEEIAAPTATLLSPTGASAMGLFGYGMLNAANDLPSVNIGGLTVSNSFANSAPGSILQELYLQVPRGVPGPADITVTSGNGTATLKSAVTYIPSANIVPARGALRQLVYDTHRNLLYALQSNQVLVFDPSSQTWLSPLIPAGSSVSNYVSMALTPDGSKIIVLDNTAETVTVFDPDNPAGSVSTPITPSTGATPQSVVATSTGKAFIACANGFPIIFDLATNTYSKTNLFNYGYPSRFVASADGTHFAGINQNSQSGTLYTWSSSSGVASVSINNEVLWTDVSIAPNGTQFAPIVANELAAGVAVALFDSGLTFTNATVYPDLAPPVAPFSMGSIFSASGLTLLTPMVDSIDFFSTQTGRLQGRLIMPELLPLGAATSGTIALDPNQQTIYAISQSGLTVATLPSTVDEVAPFPWPQASQHLSTPFAASKPRQNLQGSRQ